MAHAYALRSSHANARIECRSITTEADKSPGVLAVLTGTDWEASGWGDLPVPAGLKRRDGAAMYRHRYPALASAPRALAWRVRGVCSRRDARCREGRC